MSHLSDQLRDLATGLYCVAMYLFAVEYAFGRTQAVPLSRVAGRARSRVLVGAGAPAGPQSTRPISVPPATTDPPVSGRRSRRIELFGRAAVVFTVVGLLVQLACLVTRGLAAGRVPWGNMYEYALTATAVAVIGFLVLLARHPVRYLGGLVMIPVVLLLGLAGTVLYTPVSPLVPALNSYWLKIHVTAEVVSAGIILVAFCAAVLYLLRELYERVSTVGPTPGFLNLLGARLPDAASLERTTFRTIALAFPLFTFAQIAGAIWAEAAWGRYWGWDPKETWAFITWVVLAAYLHARSTAGWRGRKATWIVVLAIAVMMFNLFVVNIVFSGLHSYAGVN